MHTHSYLPVKTKKMVSYHSFIRSILLIVGGISFLTASSYIIVPIKPVPVTMQTFCIGLLAAFYGSRLAGITVSAWIAQGFYGVPVFANGVTGVNLLIDPTAGYIVSFLLMSIMIGWFFEKTNIRNNPISVFCVFIAGNALCLFIGGIWLTLFIGFKEAFAYGIFPFFFGEILKAILATSLLVFFQKLKKFPFRL